MSRRFVQLIVLAVAVCMPAMTSGQENSSTTLTPRISDVRVKGHKVDVDIFGLGDTLLVTVENWTVPLNVKLNKADWLLKLDGIPLPSISAVAIDTEVSPGNALLWFYLTRDTTSKKEWDALIRRPFRDGLVRPVRVGIQPQQDFVASITPLDGMQLVVLAKERFYPLLVFMLLVIFVLVLLGTRSNILRGPRGVAYSLGRTQMAWWFVIILGSYLLLGILTFDWSSTITTSALALMGISAATALGATAIDSDKARKAEEAKAQQQVLPDQMKTVEKKIEQATTAVDVTMLSSRLIEMHGTLNQASATETGVPDFKSKGFIMDLISDHNGVSLHRFQNFIWTLVLGGVYAFSVLTDLSMPEFNGTLLSLMGISSGTYVAFKFPEK